ncbi:MAG: rhodanese-like domain-containing protein [Frankiaceae bacterium]|nr:rhodanese-like domain-containing protein [Frankiaceae bacterium]MBV9869846.1 rhodanese-like domain-containing protein [Frankiaceae bacterium]
MTATAIDRVLMTARTRLERLDPHDAAAAADMGALLIDIRPPINRRIEGAIPGAIVIDRNVLEWRLDPTSADRIPEAAYDAWVVLFCNEGYASSLAAVSLQDLGIWAATDVVGGYRAWRAAGLPTEQGLIAHQPAGSPTS